MTANLSIIIDHLKQSQNLAEQWTSVARVDHLECILLKVPDSIPAGGGQFIHWEDSITFGTSHVAQVCLHHIPESFPCDVGFSPASNL